MSRYVADTEFAKFERYSAAIKTSFRQVILIDVITAAVDAITGCTFHHCPRTAFVSTFIASRVKGPSSMPSLLSLQTLPTLTTQPKLLTQPLVSFSNTQLNKGTSQSFYCVDDLDLQTVCVSKY